MEQSSIVKVFRLLEELGARKTATPLNVLAKASELSKPTAHRMLRQMSDLGYVEHVEGGCYRLTSKLKFLSAPPVERQLLAASETALEELHRELGETVNLAILRNGGITYLRVLETTQSLRRVVEADCIDPFYCTALGRAIVAQMPEKAIKHLITQQGTLKQLTTETVVDPLRVYEILEDVRRLGFAVERDETDIGVTCIGAPIFQDGHVVGAVSLSAPSARLRGGLEDRAVRAVKQTATTVTAALSS